MKSEAQHWREEPRIAVGLLQNASSVTIGLLDDFLDSSGRRFPAGEYQLDFGREEITGPAGRSRLDQEWQLRPVSDRGRFSLQATIGINFHWQQNEMQTFPEGLRILAPGGGRGTVINDVSLERYLQSVICSEMNADSPAELIKAHSIISRSWLLAQLDPAPVAGPPAPGLSDGEIVRWTDREAHATFDVCADDHCQRYQGLGRIGNESMLSKVGATRGQVLSFAGRVCDARFSKCCGGVTEDFRLAWGDQEVPIWFPCLTVPVLCPIRRFKTRPPCVVSSKTRLTAIATARTRNYWQFFSIATIGRRRIFSAGSGV